MSVLATLLIQNFSWGTNCESRFDDVTVVVTVRLGLLSSTKSVNQANTAMIRLIEDIPELSFDWDVPDRKSAVVRFSGPRHLASTYADIYRAMLGY